MARAKSCLVRKKKRILPEWDLSDLYNGTDSLALESDLKRARKSAFTFREKYSGKITNLSGNSLGIAISKYEQIDELLVRILSYAQLVHSANVTDPKISQFNQTIQETITEISANLIFFALEINKISNSKLKKNLAAPKLAYYKSWIENLRVFKAHQLGEGIERILSEKRVTGDTAWTRLFDDTIARVRFSVRGKEKTLEEALSDLSDGNSEVRKLAAKALGKGLKKNVHLFALITNTLIKDKEIETRWRKYKEPQSYRNLSNHLEDEVVATLSSAVKTAYPDLSHRYYKLKARWFGKRRLDYWDRNAPFPDADTALISWDRAKTIVLDAYHEFSPELWAVGKTFFENSWIDAQPRPGKVAGAFSHPTVPSDHPYLLLNFMGRPRDVLTLAHELGHGIHQVLASSQGHLKAKTPLTIAETASVFGEMLTFRKLFENQKDVIRRKTILAGKIEDMLNTVIRQVAFYEFEIRIHNERRLGELSADRISEIWMDIQSESLGPAIRFHDEYKFFWTYIPHFIHTPFYVYAYAFGDCLVNSLYAVYEKGLEGFEDIYIQMLKAGGTLHHKDLLAPFGLDAEKPDFWSIGLGIIGNLIDELETID